jgi:hypothetical protein
VRARFCPRRESARPFASSLPSVQRTARSVPASEPRSDPSAQRTAASRSSSLRRVRTRAPEGGATTKGGANRRSALTIRLYGMGVRSLLVGMC